LKTPGKQSPAELQGDVVESLADKLARDHGWEDGLADADQHSVDGSSAPIGDEFRDEAGELLAFITPLLPGSNYAAMPELTENLAKEFWRLNGRFNDTLPDWDDAEPQWREQTTEQAAEFVRAISRSARSNYALELRERLEGLVRELEGAAHDHRGGGSPWNLGMAEAKEEAAQRILAALTPVSSEPEEGKP
jgi:hypothetical protein